MKRVRKNQKGFTLIEIMAVVAVIGMITAMSLPHFLSLRVGANEAAAQVNLKSLQQLMEDFQFANGTYGSADSSQKAILVNFVNTYYGKHPIISNATDADLPENSYFITQGYRYDFLSDGTGYLWIAMPDIPQVTGNRYFMIQADGVIQEINYTYAASYFPNSAPKNHDCTVVGQCGQGSPGNPNDGVKTPPPPKKGMM